MVMLIKNLCWQWEQYERKRNLGPINFRYNPRALFDSFLNFVVNDVAKCSLEGTAFFNLWCEVNEWNKMESQLGDIYDALVSNDTIIIIWL